MANERKRDAILNFIGAYMDEHGVPPTVREIGDAVGIVSTSTVHGYIKRLERDGRLIVHRVEHRVAYTVV